MLALIPYLVPLGLALFVLRSQLLRVAIRAGGMENLHASPVLGAASGWGSLLGAAVLCVVALIVMGMIGGILLVVAGLALGVVGSAVFLPMLGGTMAFGHLGGEGDQSIAAFNRAYGHWLAFAVAGIAVLCLYAIFSFRF